MAIFKMAPAILHPENLSPQDSVVVSFLGGFALLAVVGIRYPIVRGSFLAERIEKKRGWHCLPRKEFDLYAK